MSRGGWVATVGAIVSGIGWALLPAQIGAGVLGFGLTHIVLGALDAATGRPRAGNR